MFPSLKFGEKLRTVYQSKGWVTVKARFDFAGTQRILVGGRSVNAYVEVNVFDWRQKLYDDAV